MLMKFLIWCGYFETGDKLIRVKSWWPSRGKYGIEWPTVLVDRRSGRRETATPIWNFKRE